MGIRLMTEIIDGHETSLNNIGCFYVVKGVLASWL
jgi:hypothetical protein